METWYLNWEIKIKVNYYELDKRRWAKSVQRINKNLREWIKANQVKWKRNIVRNWKVNQRNWLKQITLSIRKSNNNQKHKDKQETVKV